MLFKMASLYKTFLKSLVLIIIIHGFTNPIYLHSQTDSLVLSNDNLIVGEIKSMTHGVLVMKTEFSKSDFRIKWENVKRFYSSRDFLVHLSDGSRFNSNIRTSSENLDQLTLSGIDRSVPLSKFVYIKSIKRGIWGRLSASLSVGYNLTSANDLRQVSVRSRAEYLADRWNLNAEYDAVYNKQDNAEDIGRNDGIINYIYFLENDWFVLTSMNFLQNDEQKLKLRSAYSLGIGNTLLLTTKISWNVASGGVWNFEQYTSDQPNKSSVEGFVSSGLDIFDLGNFNLNSSITAYPSFTEKRRVRVDFKIDLKYKLPKEFFINLGYTHNYDNKPVEGAVNNDYVLQATFGWQLKN